jgi:hypothetical protein
LMSWRCWPLPVSRGPQVHQVFTMVSNASEVCVDLHRWILTVSIIMWMLACNLLLIVTGFQEPLSKALQREASSDILWRFCIPTVFGSLLPFFFNQDLFANVAWRACVPGVLIWPYMKREIVKWLQFPLLCGTWL